MTGDRIAPLKSERIQPPLPAHPELAALWAGFLAVLAEARGRAPRPERHRARSSGGSPPAER